MRFRLQIAAALQGALLLCLLTPAMADQPDANARVAQQIDASVHRREDGLLAYTVTEHYAVFRKHDEQHPAAEMVVKTTYQRDTGKSYSIVSESGPELMRKLLETILDHEKHMTQPANRATAVITPANYEMAVKGREQVDGRNCVAVALKPRRSSPYLFNGTVWVDAQDGSIVQLEGVTAKNPSLLTGLSEVFRQYAMIGGFPMATHSKAVSRSWMLGQLVIKVDYLNYQLQPMQSRAAQ